MITQGELRRIPQLYKSIQRDREQLNYLREKATAIASTLGRETEKVQKSPENNAGKYIEAAADLDNEIQAKETELLELQTEAGTFIDTVQDRFTRKILRLRYMRCSEWNEVADILGYDVRYLQRIESDATYKLSL